jgi:uracil-DNA glycosylase family 4
MTIHQGGFFSKGELTKLEKMTIGADITGPDCKRCGLYEGAQSPKMDVTGNGRKGVLLIAEQPGRNEDEQGTQLVGDSGQFYRSALEARGLSLDDDFYKINSVNCFGVNKPTATQITCCRPMIDKAIKELNPKFIWLLGEYAIKSQYAGRFQVLSAGRWRGLIFPERELNAWIIPQYHPSWALRGEWDKSAQMIFNQDLDFALAQLDRGTVEEEKGHFYNEEKHVRCLYDFDEVCDLLEMVDENVEAISFDYETNCLKPYIEGAKVASISLAYNSDEAFAFPYEYRSYWTPLQLRAIRRRWKNILEAPDIALRAQNLKFEDQWSKHALGIECRNWERCTMVSSHVIDDRQKFTGLKFQAYYRFGTPQYDKHIKPYLRSTHGTPFNRIDQLDLEDLLMYNGTDSLLEERLFHEQNGDIEEKNLGSPVAFHHEGTLSMSRIQDNGICVDDDYYAHMDKSLEKRIARIDKWIMQSDENARFFNDQGRGVDVGSPLDLRHLLFKTLNYEPIKETKTGYAVDEEVLQELNTPFTQKVLKKRKLEKIKGTYLAQFIRESFNGKMHPFFDLHIPRSYRSSSSQPNFQNIPARDSESRRTVRAGIIPSPGNQLLELDYGAMEVRIAACYSMDPILIEYNTREGADMHRDQALKLFDLAVEEITDDLRFLTKNDFVFAELYGSFYKACARDLWKDCVMADLKLATGDPLLEHLYDRGIIKNEDTAYEDFEAHVKEVEAEYWEMLSRHAEWQEEMIQFYLDHGYVELKHGFRRGGHLVKNKIINTPIQGTAYHCLQWSLGKLIKLAEREQWKSKIIAQIHDSVLIDADPSEVEHILRATKDVSTVQIRERYDWIVLPLIIEAEITETDGNWADIYKIDDEGYAKVDNQKVLMTQTAINW